MKACVWFLIALSIASTATADTGLGRHKSIYVVPLPGKVTIDGKLDDWDLSGQISMYVTSETADMQSGRFALMYDNDAVYLSGIVRDPSPMMNRHDPQVDGHKGWDADACQFRLSLDPALSYPVKISQDGSNAENPGLVHLILWYYTDKQQACLQMHQSMKYRVPRPEWAPHGVVPADQFQGKYATMDDGRGYTFEYRIPWSTLGDKAALKPGDLVAGTVQLNWSRPDGLTTAGGSAWCYDVMSGPGFPYQNSSCWGKVIFVERGGLPKDLVEEGLPPEKPLPLKFAYDVPEDSQVTVQLLSNENMILRTLVAQGNRRQGRNVELWDGLDEDGRPLPAGPYLWKGLYHQPITQKFLFSPHNSGQPPYHTDDNTGSWGGDHGVPTTACAFDGGVLLAWNACEAGSGILRTDLSGKRAWGSRHCATHLATDGKRFYTAGDHGFSRSPSVRVFDVADGRPLNFGNGKPQLDAPPGGNEQSDEVTGLAYANGSLFIAYRHRNLVAIVDASSGNVKSTVAVPSPGRLATRPGAEGGIAAISAGKIVAVAGGKVTPLVADHVDEPTGVAVGPDGTVYVANTGQLQCVTVFDAGGRYQRSIGKQGGRPRRGRYDKNGMLEPGGIALDAKGQLWVAETLDSPKRISLWDAQSGALVNEFFGGCDYFGYAWIDPHRPDEIYCHSVLWKIDWTANTCSPQSTVWRDTAPNMMPSPGPSGYIHHPRYFTARNGKQYCVGGARFLSILSMREGDLYKPFAALIHIIRGNAYYGDEVQFPLMADAQKYPNGIYFWQDRNDDQTVEAEEITPINVLKSKFPKIDFRWFQLAFRAMDADLVGWFNGGYRLKPKSFAPSGQPVYDLMAIEETFLTANGHGDMEIWLDPDDGGIYTLNSGRVPSLAKWSTDGKMLWGYPNLRRWHDALGLPMSAPGRLWGLTSPLGTAGDFTGSSCYFGTYHLFTRDGLYMAMLMRDGRAGGLGPDVTASETVTGQIVKPDGMNRYFLIAGAADARVTEVFGLDTIQRLPGGSYTLSADDFKLASDAHADYTAKLARSRRLVIVRGRPALDSAAPVSRAYENSRSFTARAAYDEKHLYLRFDVITPHEFTSAIADQRLLFKGGNCIDIQLAADPAADAERKTPVPGDVRVLVTRKEGKAVAVVYRPKIKDFKGEPIVLTSPTGKESFDAIEAADAVELEYNKTQDGFAALVSLPLSLLGLSPQGGQALKIDLGYLFGNAPGTQVAARAYWCNNGFSANVTNDIPNESRLEPHEWGRATFE